MVSFDYESALEKLVSEPEVKKYTLMELITECQEIKDEQFFLTESALEEQALPSQSYRYYSMLDDPFWDAKEQCQRSETNRFKICFTEHKFSDNFGKQQAGVGTHYLARVAALNSQVQLKFSKESRLLRLPDKCDASTRIMFVCMGTGIVPFIGMMERILNLKLRCKVTLVFGVRNNHSAWLYKDFLVKFFAQRQDDCKMYLACSREVVDQQTPSNIIY